MATPLSVILSSLWSSPPKELRPKHRRLNVFNPEDLKYYRTWGFTIYRTYYGQDSDKHWHTLLDALRRQTRLTVGYYDDKEVMESDEDWRRGCYRKEGRYMIHLNLFKERFRLTAREDPSLLDGLDIHGIREVCVKEQPDRDKNPKWLDFSFALVADEAVLKGISHDQYFIKAVGCDWTESDGGWGWVRIQTGQLLELWEMLLDTDLTSRNKYYDMGFDGPEEDLEKHVWFGSIFLPPFDLYSGVRIPECWDTGSSIEP